MTTKQYVSTNKKYDMANAVMECVEELDEEDQEYIKALAASLQKTVNEYSRSRRGRTADFGEKAAYELIGVCLQKGLL